VIAPTWAVRLTGNWAGFVVMVVLFLGVSILLIDAQLLDNKPSLLLAFRDFICNSLGQTRQSAKARLSP